VMQCDFGWMKLEGMDALISLCPLVIALIPVGMALRALLTEFRPRAENPAAAFYEANSRPTAYPSLATLRDMEDTMPMYVKAGDWRDDGWRATAAGRTSSVAEHQ